MSWLHDVVDANELQWDGRRRGHHEAYHLTVQDLDQGFAWWFRYTLHAPRDGEATTALWGSAFSVHDPTARFALRTEFPARHFATQSTGFHIRVSRGELSMHGTKGGLRSPKEKAHALRWNLTFDDRREPIQLLPSKRHYGDRWPPYKHTTPMPTARANGVIEVADTRFQVERAVARQAHTWGDVPPERWAWGFATGFREDPTATVEALAATPLLGERRYLVVHARDGHGRTMQVDRMRLRPSADGGQRPGVWTFSGASGRWAIEGRFSASLQSMAGITQPAPDGTDRFVHHSGAGDATVEIYRNTLGRKRLEQTLTARGTAMFEQGGLEPYDAVQFFA